MAGTFASGKHAKGICDVCGFKFMLNELRETYERGHRTNKLACWSCFDPDHPQNFQGLQAIEDAQALRKTRPDVVEPSGTPYVPVFIDIAPGTPPGPE